MNDLRRLHFLLYQLEQRVPGGIGRYAIELFHEMVQQRPAEWIIDPIPDKFGPIRNLEERVRKGRALQVLAPASLRAQIWLAASRRNTIRDYVHSPSILSPEGMRGRLSVTLHDVVPWTHPETMTKRGVEWHKAMMTHAERTADFIAVPSNTVANELSELYRVSDRVIVVPGASSLRPGTLDHDEKLLLESLPENYFLLVGTIEPRKGIQIALNAAATLGYISLVHVGPDGWGGQSIWEMARSAGVRPQYLQALGQVSDALLYELYERASALIAPSRAEGFGLPLIEAMRIGTPIICSDIPIFRETTGGHALFFPVDNSRAETALAEILDLVASGDTNLDDLIADARIQSSSFSWAQSAQNLWSRLGF